MKTLPNFFLVFGLLLCINNSMAKTWRINNQDATADYAQIQDALNDIWVVFAGDTLYVEGSPILYQGARVSRRLTIIGTGYFPNQNPQWPANATQAIFKTAINFADSAQGSKLIGVEFRGWQSHPIISTNNITIMRCHSAEHGIQFYNSDGAVIKQCYLRSLALAWQQRATNITIQNNIFTNELEIPLASMTLSICENNIFMDETLKLNAGYFRNNILLSTNPDPTKVVITSANIDNNIAGGSQFGINNGNQVSVDMSTVFINSASEDGKWQLRSNSPAKGTGYNGTDCGIFGGDDPYVLSGMPSIPVIYDLRTDGVGNAQTGLPVHIKAKSY